MFHEEKIDSPNERHQTEEEATDVGCREVDCLNLEKADQHIDDNQEIEEEGSKATSSSFNQGYINQFHRKHGFQGPWTKP